MTDGQFGDAFSHLYMLVQPLAEGVVHDPGDKRGAFPGTQAFLGLAGELRVLHLHREQIGAAFPDVIGGEFHIARQQAA